jgi:antitoxin VapB
MLGIYHVLLWEYLVMRQTAKLFMNGRSQAVRLPASFRFDCNEVYIRQDPDTGDVVISKKPGSWGDFFELADSLDIPQDFMSERETESPVERDLF